MKDVLTTAVVVGSRGQDGRYLVRLLEDAGYKVVCIDKGDLDIADPLSVTSLIADTQPQEVYFLAAYHHSSEDRQADEGVLFRESFKTHSIAPVNFLEAIASEAPSARFFYASSCLVYPPAQSGQQDEHTMPRPDNAYGISKVSGMAVCRHYREKRGVFACAGILYNHESPLRGPGFVTQKIASAAARISRQGDGELVLGDVHAVVDWGYAPDYVVAIHRILQVDTPQDYVIATGEEHTVGEFAEIAFRHVGLDYRDFLRSAPHVLSRNNLRRIGDARLLRSVTGWAPSVRFEDMVCLMVDAACRALEEPDASTDVS